MKQISYFLVVVVIVATCVSCGTSAVATKSVKKESTYRTMNVLTPALQADLQVDKEKKTGTASGSYTTVTVSKLKSSAIQNVLNANQGDVLVEPSYVVEDDGSIITVTVSGYVAKYVNFKPVSGTVGNVTVVHPGHDFAPAPGASQPAPPAKKGLFDLFKKK
jgi:hypothetical protein